jgi:NitT/TauT family transport system ATP-binding protein
MAAFVEIAHISLRYGAAVGGVLALNDISLSFDRGKFIAVVGPSGCGKSTLLKAISGLWPRTSGTMRVGGEEVHGPLKIVGMAFQNATLLPWRNTLENVLLPLQVVETHRNQFRRRRRQHEERALALLELVGLAEFARKSVWELSGGMQQRAQLCRALIHEPSLLLLDEPFGALDAFTREELWVVLQRLWLEKKPTVVLVTHDLREALFLADRVHVMSARPGTFVAERHFEAPRPRPLEIIYSHGFVDMVHELRARIDEARSPASAQKTAPAR